MHLSGLGARLDDGPELLFKLRKVDHLELISKASLNAPTVMGKKASVLQGQNLSDLFGIDISETPFQNQVRLRKALKKKSR